MSSVSNQMPVLSVRMAQKSFPSGDPKFSVMQPFPSAFAPEESDPFLMCDFFGPTPSKGKAKHPDDFPLGWHPHRGMDILSYMIEGVGRHGDSMGNREEFASPGMQWISVGSGIEHAEGGGTPAGENTTGFQIWVNVPSEKKMEDPRYGTVPPSDIPVLKLGSSDQSIGRVLAGDAAGQHGPFATVQDVQMVHYEVAAGDSIQHSVPANLDNVLVYVYRGSGSIGGAAVKPHACVQLDGASTTSREFIAEAGSNGMGVMIFAGKRLNQPVAWHGPFVMTTDVEIRTAINDYRHGRLPAKRVPWDYKHIAKAPADWKGPVLLSAATATEIPAEIAPATGSATTA